MAGKITKSELSTELKNTISSKISYVTEKISNVEIQSYSTLNVEEIEEE